MPLHRIYSRKGLFTKEDKRTLAKTLTDGYVSFGLPAFYVIVIFVDVESEDMYIGGLDHKEREAKVGVPFVRIVTQHIARSHTGAAARAKAVTDLDSVYAKLLKPRGWEYELHIEEPPADYWLESGIFPPAPGSKTEKRWIEEDKASEHDEKTLAEYFAEKYPDRVG